MIVDKELYKYNSNRLILERGEQVNYPIREYKDEILLLFDNWIENMKKSVNDFSIEELEETSNSLTFC